MIELDTVIAAINPKYHNIPGRLLSAGGILFTLWARNLIGLDSCVSPIAMESFRPFFQELFAGDKKGKIDGSRKNHFIEWLCDAACLEKKDFSPALMGCINYFFEQIEEEYGFIKSGIWMPGSYSIFILNLYLKQLFPVKKRINA